MMKTGRLLESDLVYLQQLVGAGLDGIGAARHQLNGTVFAYPPRNPVWKSGAAGATMGILAAGLIGKRRSPLTVALGGVVGSAFGFGAALAWASRRFTGVAIRSAVRHVNAARDAHWLETHPIDFA